MLDHLTAYLVAVALITVSPGPDTVLVLNRALRFGRRVALLTACGSACGLLVWGSAAAFGVAAVVAASATAFTVLKLAGAAYLGILGARILWSTWRSAGRRGVDAGSREALPETTFRQGLLTNLLNPKAAAFFTALLPQFVTPGAGATATALVYAGIAAAASLAGLAAYAQLAHHARALLGRPPVRRALDTITGSVLLGLGARLAFERR